MIKRSCKAYQIWCAMKQRCFDRKHPSYKNYGARGITVCARWMTFELFYEDMGDPPEGKSIDRIRSDGNYEPTNCVWSDRSTQNSNRRPYRCFRPANYIYKKGSRYQVIITLKRGVRFVKCCATLEEAEELRDEILYERLFQSKLGLL